MARWCGGLFLVLAALFAAIGTERASAALMIVAAQEAGGSDSAAAPAMPADAGSPAVAPVKDSYRLGVADRIRVNVFNEPTISGEFSISPGGDVSLPLIGNVAAAGRTVAEFQRDVQQRLSDGYLKEPRVAIDILTFRPFYILGEVTKPGEYPYSDGLTVMNAVATAQGYTYRANKKYVFIKHSGESAEQRVPLAPNLVVMPGDTIRVGERYF